LKKSFIFIPLLVTLGFQPRDRAGNARVIKSILKYDIQKYGFKGIGGFWGKRFPANKNKKKIRENCERYRREIELRELLKGVNYSF
jgi:hypothetical protein